MKIPVFGGLALALMIAAPSAEAAGLWPLSYSQRHDQNGKPYPGAKAYFYNASTGDPITVYREYSLATPHTNPVEAGGNGVFPGVFVDGAEEFYRFRVTTTAGVVISDDAVIPNIGPAEGEGGEPVEPVPTSSIFKTGDLKLRYDEGIHEGWVPLNGRTIGSVSSGADYAAGDNEALFLFLWAKDSARVAGGAGANAAADWAANKRYTLPDGRGRVLAGLDDMDNNAASVFAGLDVLGEALGGSVTLTAAQIPQITGATSSDGLHGHPYRVSGSASVPSGLLVGGLTTRDDNNVNKSAFTGTPSASEGQQLGGAGAHTHTVTAGAASPTAVSTTAPSMGVTIYIKK